MGISQLAIGNGNWQINLISTTNEKIFTYIVYFSCLLPIAYCLLLQHAQNDSAIVKHKIAIFAPLYLDSAFDQSNEYKYAKNVFPKFINPGLEFYEGAQLALDSLNKEGSPLEIFIYDTRSTTETLEQQLAKPELAGCGAYHSALQQQ